MTEIDIPVLDARVQQEVVVEPEAAAGAAPEAALALVVLRLAPRCRWSSRSLPEVALVPSRC